MQFSRLDPQYLYQSFRCLVEVVIIEFIIEQLAAMFNFGLKAAKVELGSHDERATFKYFILEFLELSHSSLRVTYHLTGHFSLSLSSPC